MNGLRNIQRFEWGENRDNFPVQSKNHESLTQVVGEHGPPDDSKRAFIPISRVKNQVDRQTSLNCNASRNLAVFCRKSGR